MSISSAIKKALDKGAAWRSTPQLGTSLFTATRKADFCIHDALHILNNASFCITKRKGVDNMLSKNNYHMYFTNLYRYHFYFFLLQQFLFIRTLDIYKLVFDRNPEVNDEGQFVAQ